MTLYTSAPATSPASESALGGYFSIAAIGTRLQNLDANRGHRRRRRDTSVIRFALIHGRPHLPQCARVGTLVAVIRTGCRYPATSRDLAAASRVWRYDSVWP